MKQYKIPALVMALCIFGTIAVTGAVSADAAHTDLLILTYSSVDPWGAIGVYRYTYNDGTGTYGNEQLFINLAGEPSPGNMEFGPDNNLYVVLGEKVKRYNGKTGAYIDDYVYSPGSALNNISFSPSGQAYVGDDMNVKLRQPDGSLTQYVQVGAYRLFRMAWGPDNTGSGGVPDGNPDLYTVCNGSYNPVIPVRMFGYQGDPGTAFAYPQSYPNYDMYYSIVFGPDRTGDGIPELYAGHLNNGQIYKHDGNTGAFIEAYTSPGEGGAYPCDIAFDPSGLMYVAYAGNSWCTVFTSGNTAGYLYYIYPGGGGNKRSSSLTFAPAEPPPGGISGRVTLDDYNNDPQYVLVKVELRNPGGTTPIGDPKKVEIDSGGNYTIADVPVGTYDLAFKASSWLQQVVSNVTVAAGEETTGVDVTLPNGDSDGDNQITSADKAATLTNMDTDGNP